MAADTQHELDEKGDLHRSSKGNLEVLARLYEREDAEVSGLQRLIERISSFFGSPGYFAFAVAFIVVWLLANTWGADAGWTPVDEPPFFWLQGIVSAHALLLTIAVLIRQSRMARRAEHRAHLDLQVDLLTEQKATMILQIVAELQRELPELRGRPNAEVGELGKPADPEAILHAIKRHHDET